MQVITTSLLLGFAVFSVIAAERMAQEDRVFLILLFAAVAGFAFTAAGLGFASVVGLA